MSYINYVKQRTREILAYRKVYDISIAIKTLKNGNEHKGSQLDSNIVSVLDNWSRDKDVRGNEIYEFIGRRTSLKTMHLSILDNWS